MFSRIKPQQSNISASNMFYDAPPILFEFAKYNRNHPTEAEDYLWKYLSKVVSKEFHFRRQHPIKYFIADFYCHKAKLIIEVDGGYHSEPEQYQYDRNRDEELIDLGFTILHFTNEQILNNFVIVANEINKSLSFTSRYEEVSTTSPFRGPGGILGGVLLFLFSLSVNSQEIFDLKRCLETGLQKNYDLLIIRNQQQISDNNKTWGNAGFLPTLDLNSGYSGVLNNTTQKYTDNSTVKKTNVFNQGVDLGLNFSWTIFDGLYMQTNYQRLGEFKKMGELNTKLAVENLISSIAAEYYNSVYQNLRLANLKYAVSLSKERLRIVEARYNIGSMSRLDLQQARVDFNADSSSLIKQYETVNTSRISLNRLMALEDVSQQIIVKDTLINPNPALKEPELRNNMEQSNTELLLSTKNRMVSDLDYQALKSRNYPYLKLNAAYGYSLDRYGSGTMNRQDNLGLNYGLTLGFNIFDGFNRQREQKNAKLAIQNRRLQYEQLDLSLKADLANIWMAYKNNLKLINLEVENLNAAQENYNIAIERYRLGELSGIELREAQNSLLGAEERLLQAQYNTKLCEISLMQISGQATSYLE